VPGEQPDPKRKSTENTLSRRRERGGKTLHRAWRAVRSKDPWRQHKREEAALQKDKAFKDSWNPFFRRKLQKQQRRSYNSRKIGRGNRSEPLNQAQKGRGACRRGEQFSTIRSGREQE
jgi:hypothetical protein